MPLPPLAPSVGRRERILTFGGPGTSKSYVWQRILSATPDTVAFHVIDTDGAWEPAAASPEFSPYAHRVTHHEPFEWPEYAEAMKDSLKSMRASSTRRDNGMMRSDDWLVIDLGDKAWSAAQDYYADRKYEGDSDSVGFLEAMVDGEIGDEDAMAKWGIINKLYAPFAEALIRCPGNVYICTSQKEMKKDKSGNYFRESRENVRTFGPGGFKPAGQKNLPHDLNTVLHFQGTQKGKRTFTRIKDRNREDAWGDELTRSNEDFVKSFLMGVCGWVPA